MAWQLAQLNIAKMMYAPDSPEMQDFNNALDTVNGSADASPGFVWRLESDAEKLADDLIFNDPGWLVNMSVWNELESLLSFVRSDLVGPGRTSTHCSGSTSPSGVAPGKREFDIRLQFFTTVSITGIRPESKIQDRTI